MKIIAGVDEVGRGSLIGPVYAAAVILNKSINKKEESKLGMIQMIWQTYWEKIQKLLLVTY